MYHSYSGPPNYADSMTGPVDIRDDDDQDIEGDLLFTPMYTYVYDYRPPPVYNEVNWVLVNNYCYTAKFHP